MLEINEKIRDIQICFIGNAFNQLIPYKGNLFYVFSLIAHNITETVEKSYTGFDKLRCINQKIFTHGFKYIKYDTREYKQ